MFKASFRKIMVFFFTRIIMVYAIFVGFAFWVIDVDKALVSTNLTVLDRLHPESFNYLVGGFEARKGYDNGSLEKYQFYYRKVTEVVPDQAEAFGLLGYCLYHAGDAPNAIEAYLKAIKINPNFFWFYHNLGVIYFNQGDYRQALENFQEALRANLRTSIVFILNSQRLYLPLKFIQSKRASPQAVIQQEIDEGYQQLYYGAATARQFLLNSSQPENKIMPKNLLRIFLY